MKYNTPFVSYDGSLFPVQSTTTPHTMDGSRKGRTRKEGRYSMIKEFIHWKGGI
jgi:hypothetical protein